MQRWVIHVITFAESDDLEQVAQQCMEVCRILKEQGFENPQGSIEPLEVTN
jgi:hypothetical protein